MRRAAAPIFVFTDDLSVHDSLAGAACYHEYPETLLAYDSEGFLYKIESFRRPVRMPGNHQKALRRLLRRYLVGLAVERPDLLPMGKWDAKRLPDEEVMRLLVRWNHIPDPPPPPEREHWWQFWRPMKRPTRSQTDQT